MSTRREVRNMKSIQSIYQSCNAERAWVGMWRSFRILLSWTYLYCCQALLSVALLDSNMHIILSSAWVFLVNSFGKGICGNRGAKVPSVCQFQHLPKTVALTGTCFSAFLFVYANELEPSQRLFQAHKKDCSSWCSFPKQLTEPAKTGLQCV